MRLIYTILFYLSLPWIFLRLLWRSRRTPDYRRRWAERLGFCPYQFKQCLWIHAVSVGETLAAVPLIKELKKNFPNLPLIVTNMTPTGAARVKAAFGETVYQTYIPYDLPDAVNRFLERINPLVCVIMETELWPNLFAACKKKHIPMILTNARLSEKSANGYKLISSLTREMLSSLHRLASQGKADAKRFIELGMSPEKLTITGNLKFDMELPSDLSQKNQILKKELGSNRLIWIAASTHPGEEEIILAAHHKICEEYSNALLILVPRHPDRFDGVAQLIKNQAFNVARRSQSQSAATTSVYLADTMGEMFLMYSVADVAFVAGSFINIGGHNILEPALLAKPILTGPQLFNFAEISELLLNAQGMKKVLDADELAAEVIHLFADEDLRKRMGENAFKAAIANRGALKKQVDIIREVMN